MSLFTFELFKTIFFHGCIFRAKLNYAQLLWKLCFSARSQAVMMYSCVMLVVGVLSTVTTATDGLQTSVGKLQALKDLNGVAQCATSPPNTTVTARSNIDCMRVCLSYGCSCASGANYHSDTKTCELHGHLPDSIAQVPNCIFYQVELLL